MPSDVGRIRTDWLGPIESVEPGHVALIDSTRSATYGEIVRASRATVDTLEAVGLRAGDLVAVLAPPSIEGVILIHALFESGVVLFPVNARLSLLEQRQALVSVGAAALVIQGGASRDVDAHGLGVVEELDCGLIRFEGHTRDLESGLDLAWEGNASRVCEPGPEVERARSRRLNEEAALVLHTSGTSGMPKGAVLGLDQLRASAEGSRALLGSEPSDRWLLCMPLFHIGGLSILVRAALVGAAVVIHESFEVERVSASLDQDRITRVSLVATMLDRLLEFRGDRRSPESLELLLLGGGPASQDLLERAADAGYPVAPTYGLTEAASQVATRPPERRSGEKATHEPRRNKDLAAGLRPLAGVDIRVVEERPTSSQDAFKEGAIEVRGPIVMRGYLDDDEATRAVLRDGWLSTGDWGRIDADGSLRVLDRRADLIVSGGENIYPAEIESVLDAYPGVVEVGVFGVPDARFGARPAAALVLAPGSSLDRVELDAFCRDRLAGYKRPVAFIDWGEPLPRTATGKLQRRRLRDVGSSRIE